MRTHSVAAALRVCATAALLLAVSFDAPVAAQQPPDTAGTASRFAFDTSAVHAFAPQHHWTRGVLRRLALDGVIDVGGATAAWPIAQTTVASLLRAGTEDPAAAYAGFAQRFMRERRPFTDTSSAFRSMLRIAVGGEHRANVLRAGVSVPSPDGYRYTGPVAVDDATDLVTRIELEAGWRALAVRSASTLGADDVGSDELYVLARAGSVDAWLGRRPLSIGATARGGIVLGDDARFDGAGIETSKPFRLPSFLRTLGAVRVSQTIARMDASGDVARPWFLATRVSFAPTSSLAIGFQRAAIFGGEDNDVVTPKRVLLMLLGFSDVGDKDSDFENQVASIDAYWRLPTTVPLALYGEYGTEDSGFAFVHVPALIAGIEAAPRRGSAWSAAIEHVRFARSTRDYPEWYRHGALGGGWADDGVPLGHALGGHGHATSLALRNHDARRGIVADVRGSVLRRGEENLYAPDRAGGAFALDVSLAWIVHPRVQVALDGSLEWRDGWMGASARASVFARL